MKPKGLFAKLLLSHVVILLVTLLVLGGMFNYLLQHYLSDKLEQQLRRNSVTLANNPLVKETITLGAYDVLDNLVKQVSLSIDANVIVVDAQGKIAASTAGFSGDPLSRQEIRDVLAGSAFSRWGGSFLGVPSLTVGQPIGSGADIIGAVILDTSVKGFQANLFRFRLFILYAALLAVALAAFLAYVLARGISRPILEMSRTAQALARGETTEPVKYKGQDELGLLVEVFNRSVIEVRNTLAQQEQLDQQRREFVANVSHEFRAPVTSLQGFLELMLDNVIPPQERPRYYELMLKDTARLNRLVSDLLDLAKFQAGQGQINPKPLSVSTLTEEILTKFQLRAEEKGLEVRSSIPSSSPAVLADPDRFEQIMVNLLDNALRFTPAGGWISVNVKPQAAVTLFEVEDSGLGIPAEDLPHIFERFYKVDKARTLESGGTGLGLAIVKELVEAQGGTVSAESPMCHGTLFKFTLPNA